MEMRIKNMKLSAKLIGSFLIVAAITLLVGIVSISKIKTISDADMTMYTENVLTMETVADFDVAFQKMRTVSVSICLDKFTGRNQSLEAKVNLIKEMDKNGLSLVDKYEKQIAKRDRKLFDEFKTELVKYLGARDKMIALSLEGKREEALTFMDTVSTPQADKVTELLNKVFEVEVAQAKSRSEQNSSTATSAILFSSIAAVIGTLLAVALGIFLSRSIVKPINRVVTGLLEGADQVAAASAQVSSSSQSLAEGASEQAASLEETSSSMEEMSSMTKQNANNAGQAKAMMGEAGHLSWRKSALTWTK
jgi:methyl-accepting chemotaxis protein